MVIAESECPGQVDLALDDPHEIEIDKLAEGPRARGHGERRLIQRDRIGWLVGQPQKKPQRMHAEFRVRELG